MQTACDIAVVGSGFAPALIALILRKLGRSVVLLPHSRSTPAFPELIDAASAEVFRGLCRSYGLHCCEALTREASQPQQRPALHFRFANAVSDFSLKPSAGSLLNPALLESAILGEAKAAGVTLLEGAELWGLDDSSKRAVIQGRLHGRPMELHAAFVVDASGPRGFLHRALELPEIPSAKLPAREGWLATFDAEPQRNASGDITHHVFEGGYAIAAPQPSGVLNLAVLATSSQANALGLHDASAAWPRLVERIPALRAAVTGAPKTAPTHHRQFSFLSGYVVGSNWLLLPGTAGYVDPLLSTNVPLTLLGIERLAALFAAHWERPESAEALFNYSMQTTMELVSTERFIAALYAGAPDPELFRALAELFHSAIEFTAAARAAGQPELAGGTFMLGEHPAFGARSRYCIDTALRQPAGEERADLLNKISQTRATIGA